MKALCTAVFFLSFLLSFSQAPEGMNYQAVARDLTGNPIANQSIAVKLFIHDQTATGTIVSTDSQTVTTNQFGLFTLVIGNGGGNLASVNWGSGSKFLQVEILPPGGSTFLDMGTTQLMSVPYALYSRNVQIGQTLSINGNNLSISGGNTVALPTGGSGAGIYPQTIVIGNSAGINGNTLTQAFGTATSEPGANNFVLTATWTVMPVMKDAVTGAFQSDQTHEILGYPCNNGVTVSGATTHQGRTFYTMNTGCGSGTQLLCAGSPVTLQGATYPSAGSGRLFSDGNYVYLHNADSSWIKFSVSGTTFTNQGTLMLPGTNGGTECVMCDGTYYYSLTQGIITKYTVSNNVGTVVGQKATYGAPTGLVNLDASRLYILTPSTLPGSPSNIGTAIMTPIGKP